MLHPLVQRQLRKLHLDPAAPPSAEQWAELLTRISGTYTAADQERYLRQRSQQLAEAEMQALSANLAAARDEALALARVKSDFLANISHEIRTPLNGVIGLCSLLLETTLGEEQRELASAVRSSGDALLAVVNDVLDLSKLESGCVDLEAVELSPRLIAEEVGDIVGAKAHEKGLELVIDVAPDMPAKVRGDPTRLRQVVLNLVNNAIKFTAQGEVTVRVRCLPAPTAHRTRLRVDVTDSGIGIPADRVGRLFQAFSQVDASTTRKYGGTGLGLAICRQVVAAMAGAIGVDSVEHQGSTFWFEVELEVAEAALDDAWGQGLRVMVVDQSRSARAQLAAVLTAWRCEVVDAADSPQALELLEDARVDVILLGVPDAHELARAVRAHPRHRDVKLVLTSPSRARLPDELRALYTGTLAKPLKRDQVRQSLARATGRALSGPAVPRVSTGPLRRARHGHRVLVVDDNLVNQRVTCRLLEVAGYGFAVADNGAQALDRLADDHFAAVLMDCQMPVMDGFTATRELRRRQADAPRLPVIALTAGALSSDRDACMAAEMDAFVTKPVRAVELLRVLDSYLIPSGVP